MITGSGNKFMSTVKLDSRNSDAGMWWCDRLQEYHWQLIWEDGTSWGTHVVSGSAPSREKARADIVRAIIWTEDTWPRPEYFENNY